MLYAAMQCAFKTWEMRFKFYNRNTTECQIMSNKVSTVVHYCALMTGNFLFKIKSIYDIVRNYFENSSFETPCLCIGEKLKAVKNARFMYCFNLTPTVYADIP
jgi:hypothetical protein